MSSSLPSSFAFTTSLPLFSFTYDNLSIVEQEDKLTIQELKITGAILLVISLASIFIDIFIPGLIFKNWSTFKRAPSFKSSLLCLVLALSDLVFMLLVGLPSALHLTWIVHFKRDPLLLLYSRKVVYILFRFIFIMRVFIISVLSLDRCLQILKPVKYNLLVTKRRMKCLIGLIFGTSVLIELAPTLIVFYMNDTSVICEKFQDPSASILDKIQYGANFTVPLTCATYLILTPPGTAIPLFELSVVMSISVTAWLVIVLSNLSIILMILKQLRKPINKENSKRRQRMSSNLIRGSIMVALIAAVFFTTSSPFALISLTGFLNTYTKIGFYKIGPKITFYLTVLTFLSVIIHPWIYLLRMRTVKSLLPKSMSKLWTWLQLHLENTFQCR